MRRIYEIPVPPSVNSIYRNTSRNEQNRARAVGKVPPPRVKTDDYRKWLRAAQNQMQAQQCRPFDAPAIITLNIPENTRGDLSNRFKAAEDLLVKCGVLPDDGKQYVRGVRADWSPKGQPCTLILEEA